jgi:hypothetical protein
MLKAELQAKARALGVSDVGTKADIEARIADAEADKRGRVRRAFDESVAAATHLTALDAGAVEAGRALADKIDAWDVIVEWARDDAAGVRGARPAVPQNDNVSLASFLKYAESLGLTPVARKLSLGGAAKQPGKAGIGDQIAAARARREAAASGSSPARV